MSANTKHKNVEMIVLKADIIDFKAKYFTRETETFHIDKWAIHQEDMTLLTHMGKTEFQHT